MVTRRGYGAAVGIVHNVGGNYQRLKVASSIQRAVVDIETGLIHRLHNDVTAEGAEPPDLDRLDEELASGDVPTGNLRVVDVEINSTTPRTRLKFDWEANRVISIENAAD